MTTFDLDSAARETAADLSPAMLDFVEWMGTRETPPREGATDLPEWVTLYSYPLQPWPTFLGPDKARRVERATVGLSDLVKAIPERIFDGDTGRIDAFYRFGNPLLTALMLEPPTGIGGAVSRLDFLDDAERGFRCLEANMGANIGGWQVRFWERMYRQDPTVAAFLDDHGLEVRFEDPLVALLDHVLDDTVAQGLTDGGALHLALVVDAELPTEHRPTDYVEALFRELVATRAPELEARVVFTTYPDGLTSRRRDLYLGDLPIHAVVEYTQERTPQAVYRAFKGRRVALYNGPLDAMLGDKRNLALLSEHAESDRFGAEERAILADHLPWTRIVAPGTTTAADGSRVELPRHLLARREALLIKAAGGAGGMEVHPGPTTDPAAWQAVVDRALGEPGLWIVQELLESRPYLYRIDREDGEGGGAVHDVVWGTFCFGSSWGGAFLRMVPRDRGDRVINSARGAARGFLFAIDAPGPARPAPPGQS